MTTRRIFYFARDWEPPSGGIRMIWRSVELLREAGFDAYVLHRRAGFKPPWFRSHAPAQSIEGNFRPYRDDLLVLPENHQPAYAVAPEITDRVIFCQGLYTIYRGFGSVSGWRDWCSDVLCASRTIEAFVREVLQFERCVYIPCFIDRALYYPEPKVTQIAYMPRKRRRDARFIRECFRELAPDLKRVRWVSIDGMPEEAAAAILRRSLAFVSLARLEGFGLPALEALASGCLVAGFHGGGGREYATAQNGDWFEDWDLVGVARALVHSIRDVANASPRIEAGLRTAAQYDVAVTRERLLRYWRHRIAISS